MVSPEQVTVIASVEDKEPIFQPSPSAAQPAAHAQPEDSSASTSFVTSDQLQQMSDQWAEQFARFEALLSRGNVFSTPKSTVQHVPSHAAISDTPFIPPSARLTGPVEFPAEGEVDKQQYSNIVQRDVKEQRKSRKSRKDTKDDKRSKKRQVSPSPDVGTLHAKLLSHRFRLKSPRSGGSAVRTLSSRYNRSNPVHPVKLSQ